MSAVRVTMVQIGPMRMHVLGRIVLVPVAVRSSYDFCMLVLVMPVVMPVGMDVLHRRVAVQMPVAAGHENCDGDQEEHGRDQLQGRYHFPQDREGQRRA